MNNGKKEYPITGLEVDCTSKYGRRIYCYVQNCRGIKSFVKKQMNRRLRRHGKQIAVED